MNTSAAAANDSFPSEKLILQTIVKPVVDKQVLIASEYCKQVLRGK